MSIEVTDDDEGKPVLDGSGDHVGYVADVEDGTAYVDPDGDVSGERKTRLDWGATTRDTYPLRSDAIADVTDDALRLKDEYS
jgi:hypothetical protein